MTIMVLELRPPHGVDWEALRPLVPKFLTYLLSFAFLGIYWNNHHHMLQAASKVNGKILWANIHLLFWLSIIPFVTAWMGEAHLAVAPTAAYGVVLVFCAVAYTVLQATILSHHGPDSALRQAIGSDFKGKLSVACYTAAVGLAFVNPWLAIALYVFVALVWLVPDRRIERTLS